MNDLKLRNSEPISFQARFEKSHKKLLFTAKIIPIDWDGREGYAVILDDITFQETIIKLKVADNRKDKVIATISHELRTPMNAIMGIIQIMEKISVSEEVRKFIDLLTHNCELLKAIILSIFDLQIISAGKKLNMNPEWFSLNSLLQQIKGIYSYQCEQKSISFNLKVDSTIPDVIRTDRGRIFQILVHLTSNAVKFTTKGGIRIEILPDPDSFELLIFRIIDTGCGIREEDKKFLFKLNPDEAITTHGVGLGLTFSDALVRLLNSKKMGIEIETEVNKGSTFQFRVSCLKRQYEEGNSINDVDDDRPDKPDSRAIRQTGDIKLMMGTKTLDLNHDNPVSEGNLMVDKTFSSSPALDEKNALLVDDNPFNLMVVEHFLKEQNFKTQYAVNGEDALLKVLDNQRDGTPFCIVFMDLQMPVMDGYESTRRIKKLMDDHVVATCPIIALSANEREEDKRRCLEVGMDAHLAKPLKKKDLMDVLCRYFKDLRI
jgi:signal transduction histidine kinase